MNVLILDGNPVGHGPLAVACDAAEKILSEAGASIERLCLRDMNIIHCCGRFDCWEKTPGQCSTKDDGRQIGGAVTRADMLVLVTPVSFGGYGFILKSAMDRCLPALYPYLDKFRGEVHHSMRGGRVKSLAVIGGLPAPDMATENVMRRIVGRNALNMRSPAHDVVFVYDDDDDVSASSAAVMVLQSIGVRGGEVRS